MPPKEVLRLDKIGSRSILYLEEQVVRDGSEWGLAPNNEVRLVSEEVMLHTVHRTNSLPILNSFFNGRMRDLWGREHTPGYRRAHAGTINIGDNVRPRWVCIRTPNGEGGSKFRAVFWDAPRRIIGFSSLWTCIDDCFARINDVVRVSPDPSLLVRGCEECNAIMTQEGTMRHLLVRTTFNPEPLVPLNSIYRYELNGDPSHPANVATIRSGRRVDPNAGNVSGIHFSFQATLAYYIQRCLRGRPAVITARYRELRKLYAMFAYLLLMILCLMTERTHGKGGSRRLVKPVYRYRGLIEFYTSYAIYLLLSNDTADGEVNNGIGMQMSLPIFHKFWFGEFFDMLVHFDPNFANFTEISDIIFSSTWFDGGNPGFVPGPASRLARP